MQISLTCGPRRRRWCLEVAGTRIHGTTRRQPLTVFIDEEREALGKWDGEPYEMTEWRTAKVHADHHISCRHALYSVPVRDMSSGPGGGGAARTVSWSASTTAAGSSSCIPGRDVAKGPPTLPTTPSELSAYNLRSS